jgi:hypothetical protein
VKRDASFAQFGFLGQRDTRAEPKEGSPKKKMRINPQKRLAQSYEASNMQDGVWCELVKLHTINKKKPMKEFMGRKGETAQKIGKEHHPKTISGLGDPLSAGEDNLVVVGDETIRSGLLQLLLRKGRRYPARHDVRTLGHLVLLRLMLHAHLRSAHGGSAGDQRRAEIAAMMAAPEAMNW